MLIDVSHTGQVPYLPLLTETDFNPITLKAERRILNLAPILWVIGLAVLASLAASRTTTLKANGEDALARFEAALFPRALPAEMRALAGALGCALSEDMTAPIDVPFNAMRHSSELPANANIASAVSA